MGIVLALVSSLLWGVADFAGGTASRSRPALVVVAASQAVGLIAVAAVATVEGSWSEPLQYLPWAIAAGLVGATGLLTFYQALASGTMGVVSPIAALSVVVPVVVGLITGQWPPLVVGVGFVLAIAGVVAASGPERSAGRSLRPVALALVAAVCFGVVLILIAQGAATSPLMTMVAMRVTSVGVLSGVLLAVAVGSRRRVATGSAPDSARADARRGGWTVVAIAGLFDVGANLAFAVASTVSVLAIVAILGSLYPAVTVILARFVHGETMTRLQQAGIAVALIGVALIAGWS
jgi:drug/metabolite transporter (DMT)-like permease